MTSLLAPYRRRRLAVTAALLAAGGGGVALAAGRLFIGTLAIAFAITSLAAQAFSVSPQTARFVGRALILPDPRRTAPSDRMTVAAAACLVVFLIAMFLPTWRTPPPLMPIYDDHQWASLNIAAARAACGAASAKPDFDIAERLSGRADVGTPIRDIAPFSCASIWPFVIADNTLMLIEATVLRVNPRASLATIARTLLFLQFAGLAVFAMALCVAGLPPLWSALLLLGAHTLIASLLDQYMYAVYPLMIPAIAGLIGIVTIGTRARSAAARLAVAVVVGLAIGPIVQLRSDLLPACVAIIGLWLFTAPSPRRVVWQLLIIGAGAVAFQLATIRPIQSAEPQRPTTHSVLHPVVLGLAIPENPVATSLGLRWDDTVGWDLAHRLQPGLNVNTPAYETTLRRFYFGLWRDRPRDMAGIYALKLRAAAQSIVVDSTGIGFDGQFWRAVLRPLSVGAAGVAVPLMFALAVVGGTIASRRFPRSWTFPLTALVTAGAINWVESVLVFSHFTPHYFGLAYVGLVACCLALYQIAWQAAWWPMNRSLFANNHDPCG